MTELGDEVMLVVSVVASKGGCGKSTLATNLAVQAAKAGHGALVIDLDPQATSWTWGQKREAALPAVVASQAPALSKLLAEADAQGVGVVVIDTPPRADTVGVQAAKASHYVLIPCQPSDYDLEAMAASLMAAQMAGRPASIVINGAIASSGITEDVASALEKGGAPVSPARLGLRMDFRHGLARGMVAGEWAPKSKAAQEVEALWDWLCQQPGMAALRHGSNTTQQHEGMPA